jgi:beta-glucanase (GH16 family)
MLKKILIGIASALVVMTAVGCGLTTGPATTLTTTEASTATTTQETTTGVTTTRTALVDAIPDECSELAIVDGWVPVWCDEFTEATPGTVIDTSKWTFQTGGGGFGNQELQYYTGSAADNVDIVDGALVITARKENYGGMAYTSDKIWTQQTASWKYGKFEMRAKLPSGRGTWPAFWMMPKSSKYGGWPDSGEIDIMEHVGYDMNNVLGTVHTERYSGTNGRGGNTSLLEQNGTVPTIDVANVFHTYGIIWTEEKIEWYFDGFLFGDVAYDPIESVGYNLDTSVDWPFDQSFYLILNLAVGGSWGGAQGVDNTIFPTSLTVDYVRVYQQDYVTGDAEVPGPIRRPTVLWQDGKSVFLSWNASLDDKRIRYYHVFVNGVLAKKTAVTGVLLTTLKLDFDNFITILAEDYAGNMSAAFDTVIGA